MVVYRVDFSGVWAKVERAKDHRDALENYIVEFFEPPNRPAVRADLDVESGYYVFRVTSTPDLSEFTKQCQLRYGDCIHNLRAALDHLTYQLALWNKDGVLTEKEERSIQFPITSAPETWKSAKARDLRLVHHDHVAMIDEFQPYKGGNGRPDNYEGDYVHELTWVRDLDDRDKHRLLNVVFTIPGGGEFSLPPDMTFAPIEFENLAWGQMPIEFAHVGERLEVGAEAMRAKLIGATEEHIDMAGYTFPGVQIGEGRGLMPMLDRVAGLVSKIVSDFEQIF